MAMDLVFSKTRPSVGYTSTIGGSVHWAGPAWSKKRAQQGYMESSSVTCVYNEDELRYKAYIHYMHMSMFSMLIFTT